MEYASQNLGSWALATGLGGIAAALLLPRNGGNGGGLGILGGGYAGGGGDGSAVAAAYAAQQAGKIGELEAIKHSEKSALEVYKQAVNDNKELRSEFFSFIKPLSDEAASNRERVAVLEAKCLCENEKAELREKLVRAELGAKIDTVAQTCACGIQNLQTQVFGLQRAVGSFTKTVIDPSSICPPVMPRYNSFDLAALTGTGGTAETPATGG